VLYCRAACRMLVLVPLDDVDPDTLGHHWRRIWPMVLVCRNELQRVRTGGEHLCLAGAKVQVVEVVTAFSTESESRGIGGFPKPLR
jgi:hypothetical protein